MCINMQISVIGGDKLAYFLHVHNHFESSTHVYFQGCIVAIIVCYTNGRVIECIRKTWRTRMEQRELRKQSIATRLRFRYSMGNDGDPAMTERVTMDADDMAIGDGYGSRLMTTNHRAEDE